MLMKLDSLKITTSPSIKQFKSFKTFHENAPVESLNLQVSPKSSAQLSVFSIAVFMNLRTYSVDNSFYLDHDLMAFLGSILMKLHNLEVSQKASSPSPILDKSYLILVQHLKVLKETLLMELHNLQTKTPSSSSSPSINSERASTKQIVELRYLQIRTTLPKYHEEINQTMDLQIKELLINIPTPFPFPRSLAIKAEMAEESPLMQRTARCHLHARMELSLGAQGLHELLLAQTTKPGYSRREEDLQLAGYPRSSKRTRHSGGVLASGFPHKLDCYIQT
ncbi:hypothetical protein BKA61DRAFT_721961 [Leptodontidium sp. MPI-SDFR-AT-0119]|nr:hypothetical protein BKA61DRAFT_721961 [Leptodontidium sp. MPI-SDFR-AT-0119]